MGPGLTFKGYELSVNFKMCWPGKAFKVGGPMGFMTVYELIPPLRAV
jgi:hypothetical protein